jgi:hypothetical protein
MHDADPRNRLSVSSPARTAVSLFSSRRATSTTSPLSPPRPPPSVPRDRPASTSLPASSKTHLNASNQHAPSTKHTLTMHRTYTAIVNSTTKRNYRPDLRQDAVARASAIRKSQRAVKKADKPTKTRGAKAQKAAAASA